MIAFRDGKLILNGKVMPQRELDEQFTDERGIKMRVLEEDLDGCRHPCSTCPARADSPRSR
jgi:hypothetical protein